MRVRSGIAMPHWEEFRGRFEPEQIQRFVKLWNEISADDDHLRRLRDDLCERVYWADEVGLMDGTEPMLSELQPFSDFVMRSAKLLDPAMSEFDLIDFSVFCLYFDPDDPDIVSAGKS